MTENLLATKSAKNEAYRNFYISLSARATKKTYDNVLIRFLRFLGLENDSLKYQKLAQDYDAKTLENRVIDYIIKRKEDSISDKSIRIDCAALKHFFDMNDVYFRWTKKIQKFKNMKIEHKKDDDDSKKKNKDRSYTMEEIRQGFNGCKDIRAKVMISLMSSTGMRKGAFEYIRLRNLEPIDEYGIYKITVYEGEDSDEYFTFCTPECRREIDKYLDYRQRNGEELKPSAPLIRDQFDFTDHIIPKARFLTDGTLNYIIKTAFEVDSNVRTNNSGSKERTKREVPLNHGFRKFFETVAINNGVSVLYVRRLLGQKSGLEDSYFKPTWKDLLEGNDKVSGYLSIIDELTINEENKLRLENKKLKKELDFTDREIAMMKNGLRTMATRMGLDLEQLDEKFIEKHPGYSPKS